MGPVRICIADDHPVVVDGIRMMLDAADGVKFAGAVPDGLALLEFLSKEPVDVVLLDLEMPRMNGMEACKQALAKHPHLGVIVLSMQQEVSVVKAMLELGARGYLLKNADREEILTAIREVYQGKQYISKTLAQLLINALGGASSSVTPSLFPALSRREKEVLTLIVEEYTTREIAAKLSLSPDTIETHRRRLLTKLNVRNTAGLVRVCVEHNLLKKE